MWYKKCLGYTITLLFIVVENPVSTMSTLSLVGKYWQLATYFMILIIFAVIIRQKFSSRVGNFHPIKYTVCEGGREREREGGREGEAKGGREGEGEGEGEGERKRE